MGLSERPVYPAIGAISVYLVHGLVISLPIGAAGVLIWGFWAAAPGRGRSWHAEHADRWMSAACPDVTWAVLRLQPSSCESIADVNVQPEPLDESPFLLACRRQPVPCTPVWYMRQAGESLPEVPAAHGADSRCFEACSRQDVITEITLQPMRRYRVDAAILFSDIVVPLQAVGLRYER